MKNCVGINVFFLIEIHLLYVRKDSVSLPFQPIVLSAKQTLTINLIR